MTVIQLGLDDCRWTRGIALNRAAANTVLSAVHAVWVTGIVRVERPLILTHVCRCWFKFHKYCRARTMLKREWQVYSNGYAYIKIEKGSKGKRKRWKKRVQNEIKRGIKHVRKKDIWWKYADSTVVLLVNYLTKPFQLYRPRMKWKDYYNSQQERIWKETVIYFGVRPVTLREGKRKLIRRTCLIYQDNYLEKRIKCLFCKNYEWKHFCV
jgi:hypothetical protein